MIIENKLNKRIYKNLVLQELLLGKITSLIILVPYAFAWKIVYSVAKEGHLKNNIPLFLRVCYLLILILLIIFGACYRHMRNSFFYKAGSKISIDDTKLTIESNEPVTYNWDSLSHVKENNKWYFLFFKDRNFLPISKDMDVTSLEKFKDYVTAYKPVRRTYKWVTVLCLMLVTLFGAYNVYNCAVKFHGALAWKVIEFTSDKKVRLKDTNFYTSKLNGIINSVKTKENLEPHLMTNSLDIKFKSNGTITSIDSYIYGFDKNYNLKSGYLLYYDKSKGSSLTIHKQNWSRGGSVTYDKNNDLSIVINMLNKISIKQEVNSWHETNLAITYKGIRNWGYNMDGIRFIDKNGLVTITDKADHEISGPTISLYCPGKEQTITPHRFVYDN